MPPNALVSETPANQRADNVDDVPPTPKCPNRTTLVESRSTPRTPFAVHNSLRSTPQLTRLPRLPRLGPANFSTQSSSSDRPASSHPAPIPFITPDRLSSTRMLLEETKSCVQKFSARMDGVAKGVEQHLREVQLCKEAIESSGERAVAEMGDIVSRSQTLLDKRADALDAAIAETRRDLTLQSEKLSSVQSSVSSLESLFKTLQPLLESLVSFSHAQSSVLQTTQEQQFKIYEVGKQNHSILEKLNEYINTHPAIDGCMAKKSDASKLVGSGAGNDEELVDIMSLDVQKKSTRSAKRMHSHSEAAQMQATGSNIEQTAAAHSSSTSSRKRQRLEGNTEIVAAPKQITSRTASFVQAQVSRSHTLPRQRSDHPLRESLANTRLSRTITKAFDNTLSSDATGTTIQSIPRELQRKPDSDDVPQQEQDKENANVVTINSSMSAVSRSSITQASRSTTASRKPDAVAASANKGVTKVNKATKKQASREPSSKSKKPKSSKTKVAAVAATASTARSSSRNAVNANASVIVVGTGVYDSLNTSASGSVQPVQPPPSCAPAAIPMQQLVKKTLLRGLGSDDDLLGPSPPEDGASGTSGDGDLYADSETEARVDNYLSGLHASRCVLVEGSGVAVAPPPAIFNNANANTSVYANTNANAMMHAPSKRRTIIVEGDAGIDLWLDELDMMG